VDREAKKRGTAVHLVNRICALLPPKLSREVCSLTPGQDRFTVSVVFNVNPHNGSVADGDTWVGKGIIKSGGKVSLDQIDAALSAQPDFKHEAVQLKDLQILNVSYFPHFHRRFHPEDKSNSVCLGRCAEVP